MNDLNQLGYWVRKEIPSYLNSFRNYESFLKNIHSASSSIAWKTIAHEMAVERWNVSRHLNAAYKDAVREIR